MEGITQTTPNKENIWHSEEECDQLIPLRFFKENIYLPTTALFFRVDT